MSPKLRLGDIINLFSPWYSWKIAELVLNNNHLLTHSIKPWFYYISILKLIYVYYSAS
jgi:hypothetical protein